MSILEVRGLGRTYTLGERKIPVLIDVDLVLDAGGSMAIVGPSGSGKSTLLGLVAGLDLPSAGSVRVAGQDLAALSADGLAAFRGRHIGFVFQSYRLLPTLTALENVQVAVELAGLEDAVGVAGFWLERVGLAERRDHLPARLSGGEQQRVALARAMAVRPVLLLADEPTGNLDSKSGAAITELLFSLVGDEGAALLLATHDQELAARCGRCREMLDGRMV